MDTSLIEQDISVTELPRRPPQSKTFIAVVQQDEHMQVEVFNWLKKDPTYRLLYILHDRDVYTDTDKLPDAKSVGDKKNPHYHLFVVAPRKISANTMSKRFGNYVHFLLCADPFEQIRYMTHSTFQSRDKAQYEVLDLRGDLTLLHDYAAHPDFLEDVSRISDLSDFCDRRTAVKEILRSGDKRALQSLMAHAHFYDKFIFSKE